MHERLVVAVRASDTLGPYAQQGGSGEETSDTDFLGETRRRSDGRSVQSFEADSVSLARGTAKGGGPAKRPRKEKHRTEKKQSPSHTPGTPSEDQRPSKGTPPPRQEEARCSSRD